MTAKSNIKLLAKQACKYKPKYLVVEKESDIKKLKSLCGNYARNISFHFGKDSLNKLSSHYRVSCVVSAITGAAALEPTYNAVKAGKKVLLANKESLIMSGDLLLKVAKKNKASIIPIDSEHNALLQIVSMFGYNFISDRKKCRIILIIFP